ncbi:ABC transporter ATP-binding protein [bacterium]|nr:ABC transporter ATP-binding protein [bacterium]
MQIEPVARAVDITKSYCLYKSHADRVKETFHPLRRSYHQNFNALHNINFEAYRGETLGIIGRNGCGKSTLLQIVCGILQPSSGRVITQGRISALLELGAGFNPEFTGRQNVFLNAAILGLTKEEIEDRFDAIVDFAEIGQFIGQPVKTYSSGMYVRLAFSVAISVEPDILVVDEALAVGDELFQRKCFGRIKELRKRGTTILFVSHGADTVVQLCDRVLLLDQGECLLEGDPKFVVAKYQKLLYAPPDKLAVIREEIKEVGALKRVIETSEQNEEKPKDVSVTASRDGFAVNHQPFFEPGLVPKSLESYESLGVKIKDVQITTPDNEPANNLVRRQEYIYKYKVVFERSFMKLRFGMMIKNLSGIELGGATTAPSGQGVDSVGTGEVVDVTFRFRCLLQPGIYFVNAGVMGQLDGCEAILHRILDAAVFKVIAEKNLISTQLIDFYIEPDAAVNSGG